MKYYNNYEYPYRNILFRSTQESDPSLGIIDTVSLEAFFNKILEEGRYPIGETLVVGSGTGKICEFLNFHGFAVTGIDISPSAIAHAEKASVKNNSSIEYLTMDATQMNFQRSFDLIVDNHCLHCLVFKQDREGYLSQVAQHLKPQGYFVLETMIYTEKMQFSDQFLLDDDRILWSQTLHKNWYGVVSFQNQSYLPSRKLISAYDLETELLAQGLRIDYFVYCNDLKMEIPGNQDIPMNSWPGLMRVICSKPK